ncbi:MAG: hypothetical protein ACI901_000545, partial [Octadecabacter sp.]
YKHTYMLRCSISSLFCTAAFMGIYDLLEKTHILIIINNNFLSIVNI